MRRREFLRHFKIYFAVGFIFIMLAAFGRILIAEIYNITDHARQVIQAFGEVKFMILMSFISAFWIGLFSSLFDVLVLKKLFKKRSLGIVLIVDLMAQIGMLVLVVTLMTSIYEGLLCWISNDPIVPPKALDIIYILVYLILAVATSKFLIEIDRKLGHGNLWKVLTGRFYQPHEEERIFMFIDMKGATTIAENIGHLEFSKLLQDCFKDFSIVDRYRTDIYQYVGDEVVVSWTPKNGLKNNNFLNAFFAFDRALKIKSEYYQEQYGINPYFKAGANIGPVIVTEVGDIKREITCHGDTVNTASRIQEKCNVLDAQMLIPEALYLRLKQSNGFHFEDVGSSHLKGKEQDVHLYRVTQL